MLNRKYLFICPVFLLLQAYLVYPSCLEKKEINGVLSDSYIVNRYDVHSKCWKILNPAKNELHIRLTELNLMQVHISYCNLTIALTDEGKNVTYGSAALTDEGKNVTYGSAALTDEGKNVTYGSANARGIIKTTSSVVEIHFIVRSQHLNDGYKAKFTLHFEFGLGMVDEEFALSRTITWLRNQRFPLLDWRENTMKAMTALYLSGNATFNGTEVREELLIRRAEFSISRDLQSNTVSEVDLSSYINFLLVTCTSPRHFASGDLIQQLKSKLESSRNFTHPTVYLALCNANETWPQRAVTDLTNILTSRSEYLFLKDIQAFALMAISCKMSQIKSSSSTEKASLLPVYRTGIVNLKQKQLSDGSFGGIHETALAIQALMSSGEEFSLDWNSRAAVRYVAEKLNSSQIDFQAAYLSLPLLNRKSLVDIAKRNCSGNPRNNEDLIDDFKGFKIEVPSDKVRYSLFIGDNKELIRTTTIQVPYNFTAYQVMQLAEVQNEKFKFEWGRISGKMYVQKISQILNNPENGKFWLLHLDSNSRRGLIPYYNKGPDEVIIKHGDHLIMWYKTIEI